MFGSITRLGGATRSAAATSHHVASCGSIYAGDAVCRNTHVRFWLRFYDPSRCILLNGGILFIQWRFCSSFLLLAAMSVFSVVWCKYREIIVQWKQQMFIILKSKISMPNKKLQIVFNILHTRYSGTWGKCATLSISSYNSLKRVFQKPI